MRKNRNKKPGTKSETRASKPGKTSRKAAPRRAFYIVAGVWRENDGSNELVSNAVWYDTVEEAKRRATEWATDLYDQWVEDTHSSPFFDRNATFDDKWEKVDNLDPEFMDWGFDPVDNDVASVSIRVFKAYRGK